MPQDSSPISLPPAPKHETEAIEVFYCKEAAHLGLTLSSIEPQDEKYFVNCLAYLFKCLDSLNLQEGFKYFYLDVRSSVVRYRYWNSFIGFLKKNIDSLQKISYLNMTASCFSLRQLRDCYQLFQVCQQKKIKFPEIIIEMTTAAQRLTLSDDIGHEGHEKHNENSSGNLKELVKEESYESPDEDFNEPSSDIWREEFMKAITKDGIVDKIFFQHLLLHESQGSLYDYWKKQGHTIMEP